jgi:NPCBM/NEW2 domain
VRTFIQRESVTFEVYLNHVKAYDSGLMTDSPAPQSITRNVANKNELKLMEKMRYIGNTSTVPYS